MKRLLSRDALAGLMFIAFAAWGFIAAADLEGGTSAAMGPGYFPRIVSSILLLLGTAILVVALWSGDALPPERGRLRPIFSVSLAGLVFAALLEKGGIIAAITAAVLIGVMAGERPRPLPLVALTGALILVSIALFIWGIGVPIPIWPDWEAMSRRWI